MKKKNLSFLVIVIILFSSCYTSVSTVGNCKYYYRRPIGSLHRINAPRF